MSLEISTQRTSDTVAAEIRVLKAQAQQMLLSYAIEIGRRLCEAKALVPHGSWGNYLTEQVDYSQSTAQNLIKIFEAYSSDQINLMGEAKSQAFGSLTYTKALALLALPEQEREIFVEQDTVEGMSTREFQKAVRERAEAIKAREKAEQLLDGARAELDEALKSSDKACSDADRLEKQLHEIKAELKTLKEAPREVAVETVVDQGAIDQAVKVAKEAEEKAVAPLRERLAVLEQEQVERKELVDKIATLEKQLDKTGGTKAEATVSVFKLHFQAAQVAVNEMASLLDGMEESAERDGLQNALRELLKLSLEVLNE